MQIRRRFNRLPAAEYHGASSALRASAPRTHPQHIAMISGKVPTPTSQTASVADHPLNRLSWAARIASYFGVSAVILVILSVLLAAAGDDVGWRSPIPVIVLLLTTSALMELERRMPRPASPWVRRAAAVRDAVLAAALFLLTAVLVNTMW